MGLPLLQRGDCLTERSNAGQPAFKRLRPIDLPLDERPVPSLRRGNLPHRPLHPPSLETTSIRKTLKGTAVRRSRRYETSHLLEDRYEPGSRGLVLKNLLGIRSKREMDRVEGVEYARALSDAVRMYGQQHHFVSEDVRRLHKPWLGTIYPWAGQYRQVNLVKDEFPFAFAMQISRLMEELEQGPLARFTPCGFDGVASGIATPGFRRGDRTDESGIFFGSAGRLERGLQADGEDI